MVTTEALRTWRTANQQAHATTVSALQKAVFARQTEKIGMAIALHQEACRLLHVWRKESDEREAETVQLYLGFARGAQLVNRYEPKVGWTSPS